MFYKIVSYMLHVKRTRKKLFKKRNTNVLQRKLKKSRKSYIKKTKIPLWWCIANSCNLLYRWINILVKILSTYLVLCIEMPYIYYPQLS